MGFATNFDPLLRIALLSGIAVAAITLLLLIAIIVLRVMADHRDARTAAIKGRWQPVFLHALDGLPYSLPRIYGRDREVIMLIWLHYSELLRGAARVRLRDLARELQLVGTAMRLLHRRDMRGRLLAVVGLGRMEAPEAWAPLYSFMDDANPVLSMSAARSLLQIDAAKAADPVIAAIAGRDDWSRARVATMLSEVRDPSLGRALVAKLHDGSAAEAARLLPLLDLVPVGDRWPVVAQWLTDDTPVPTLVAALKAVDDPRGLIHVRRLAGHAEWPVRTQAASALARIGSPSDAATLQVMLTDAEWWVRYRAAGALLRMPSVTRESLEALASSLTDRYAADMLKQVLAEGGSEAAE